MNSNTRLIAILASFAVAALLLWYLVSGGSSNPGPEITKVVSADDIIEGRNVVEPSTVVERPSVQIPLERKPIRQRRNRAVGSIGGVVADVADLPLGGVEVVLRGPRGQSDRTVSGSDGAYFFDGLAEASYTIEATMTLDAGNTVDTLRGSVEVSLAFDEHREGLRIRLEPDGSAQPELTPAELLNVAGPSIRGRVIDASDRPVAGVLIEAVGHQQVATAVSTPDGDFAIGSLEEEVYTLSTSTDEYTNTRLEGVRADSVGHVLRVEATAIIVGQVIQRDRGVPVTQFQYAVLKDRPRDLRRVSGSKWTNASDAEGRLEIDGVQAKQVLWLTTRAEGYIAALSEIPPIMPGEKSYPVSIPLDRGGRIEGHVLNSAGEGVPGATVYQVARGSRRFVLARSAEEGFFAVDGLEGVEIDLMARHEDYMQGDVRATLAPGTVTRLDITLPEGGVVEGTIVRGDTPVPNVNLTLVSAYNTSINYKGVTGTDGKYSVRALPPGSVTIFVHADASRKKEYANYRTTAMVDAGEVTVVDVVYPASYGVLEGRVTLGGTPPTEGRVIAQVTNSSGEQRFNANIFSDGTYHLDLLPPGVASLNFYAKFGEEAYRKRTVTFTLVEGGLVQHNLDYATKP